MRYASLTVSACQCRHDSCRWRGRGLPLFLHTRFRNSSWHDGYDCIRHSSSFRTSALRDKVANLDNVSVHDRKLVLNQSGGKGSNRGNFIEGNAYLLTVAVLWGSYTPVLKVLFNLEGGPTPELVAWIRGVIQVSALGAVLYIHSKQKSKVTNNPEKRRHMTQLWSTGIEVPTVLLGAVEIGFYNSCATLLQTEGISMSGAIRAGFLIQATALWTPMLSSAFGERPSSWQWAGSLLALSSALIVTLDQRLGSISTSINGSYGFPNTGDLFILGATVVYSLATVRIPSYAKNISPLELATGKSSALAIVSSILLLFEISSEGGISVSDLWPAFHDQSSAWFYLMWAGLACGALTAFLHVKGQSLVTATEAQLVFSTVPLWSAIIAAGVLPDEHLGPLTWLGGGLMIVAGYISTLSSHKE
jgi:drug/metabolite transporter (DMT)-like permease